MNSEGVFCRPEGRRSSAPSLQTLSTSTPGKRDTKPTAPREQMAIGVGAWNRGADPVHRRESPEHNDPSTTSSERPPIQKPFLNDSLSLKTRPDPSPKPNSITRRCCTHKRAGAPHPRAGQASAPNHLGLLDDQRGKESSCPGHIPTYCPAITSEEGMI